MKYVSKLPTKYRFANEIYGFAVMKYRLRRIKYQYACGILNKKTLAIASAFLAPPVGLEPTTTRLTAAGSTS